MGLIKAAIGSAGGTLADQWKEFFYCDSLTGDVLVAKGKKQTSKRSSNTKGSENVITNGSTIAVAVGQCMIITEQGKVVEICAEPGEFVFDSSSEPSVFSGPLGEGIKASFKTFAKRFTYGGDTAKDQRIYFINTKELVGNKFGTANPVPFRVVDPRIGLDVDVSVRCSGVFSYRIEDPIRFYAGVCGNVENVYTRENLDGQLKTEFLSVLQPALATLSDMGLRPNQIVAHNMELENAMNEALLERWSNNRGIKIESIAIGSVTLPDEDAELIKNLQKNAVFANPTMAAANLAGAQADAMRTAAGNTAGAMTGFMGMNMANAAGGMNTQNLFSMGQPLENSAAQQAQPSGWICACGTTNTGKFCSNCGAANPTLPWTCACGAQNTGKFCSNCGKPRQ